MSLVFDDIIDLPPKIQTVVTREGVDSGFKHAIKTNYKPNSTIPILWLIVTIEGILLCNTHNSRGLTGKYSWREINAVRINGAGKIKEIEIIFNALTKDNINLPMPEKTTSIDLHKIIETCTHLKESFPLCGR